MAKKFQFTLPENIRLLSLENGTQHHVEDGSFHTDDRYVAGLVRQQYGTIANEVVLDSEDLLRAAEEEKAAAEKKTDEPTEEDWEAPVVEEAPATTKKKAK